MDTSKESTNKLAQIGKKSFENQRIQRSGKGTLKPVPVSTSIEFNKNIFECLLYVKPLTGPWDIQTKQVPFHFDSYGRNKG